jgi:hypothetical protein
MEWNTFAILVMFFAKDKEMRSIMTAMGIVNDAVEKTLNMAKEGN